MRLIKHQPPPTWTLELTAEELNSIKYALFHCANSDRIPEGYSEKYTQLYTLIRNASEK